MSEIELIELAAKAIGKDLTGWNRLGGDGFFRLQGGKEDLWIPGRDINQALEIADKLGFMIDFGSGTTKLSHSRLGGGYTATANGNHISRVICTLVVRAAAEIGKAM